jgi:hypothetical protein
VEQPREPQSVAIILRSVPPSAECVQRDAPGPIGGGDLAGPTAPKPFAR